MTDPLDLRVWQYEAEVRAEWRRQGGSADPSFRFIRTPRLEALNRALNHGDLTLFDRILKEPLDES